MEIIEANGRLQTCITDEQAQFFLDNGFLVIREVLHGEELQLLQTEMMELIEQGKEKRDINADFFYARGTKSGEDVLKRVEYVIDKKSATKGLLGHPFILRSVEKLQGASFIPTWDSMVIKMPDEGIIVPWHRDSEPPETSDDQRPLFNVDFYLDHADLGTCLWVIPGSNKWTKEAVRARINQEGQGEFSTEDAIPVPMNPGDVIFHDIMVLHGSPSGDGNDLRRTIYYEFRPGMVELEHGPHTTEYLPLKQQVLLDCIEIRQQAPYAQNEVPYVYQPEGELALGKRRSHEAAVFRYPHAEYWRR